MTRCVGIRGATTVDEDSLEEVLDATQDLLARLQELNGFSPDDLASIVFTTSADIRSTFPARAARRLGWTQVPMLCAQEIDAPEALARCVRVLIHWNADTTPAEVRHAYLRGSRILRPDWAVPPIAGPAGHVTAPERPIIEAEEATHPDHAGGAAASAAAPAERAARTAPASSEPEVAPQAPATAAPVPLDLGAVAVLGEPGSFSQEALASAFGRATPAVFGKTFRLVFDAVHSGRAKAALVPVENSTSGPIYEVYDLLLSHDLQIVAEVVLPVRHALLAPPGTALADVRTVVSHPQALSQCNAWIETHGWAQRPTSNTAGAARLVGAAEEPGLAAIASPMAGELHGLTVLANDIQDVSENYTRFILLVPSHIAARPLAVPGFAPGTDGLRPVKTSIIFATRHVAGDLYGCLAEFAVRDINLTRIESRPDRRTPWHYLFYLDFEGEARDPRMAAALRGIQRHATFIRVLGSYPSRALT